MIKDELLDLKERMLDNIHLIRETCNELRPPFLSELGITESLQHLIDQTKLRWNFMLKSDLDPSIQMINKEYELPVSSGTGAIKQCDETFRSLCSHDIPNPTQSKPGYFTVTTEKESI